MGSSLTSPSDTMIKDAIQEIAIGNEKLEDRLERDVTEVCKCLDENFARPFFHTIIKSQLQKNLSDIYWCLKLHLAFHLGPERALQHEKLKEFGHDVLKLTEEQLNNLPDETHAIDPGSKVLEMINVIVECPAIPKGSKGHADEVMEIAKTLFCDLSGKNTFRPKVLAKVSLNEKAFVGSSISVSHFLRPLCLHKRVVNFKRRLQRAVVFGKPLFILHNQAMNWSSSAFMKEGYTVGKAPCQKCQIVLKNLGGFISTNGDGENEDGGTFWGACAEYVPVNELIREEDTQAAAYIEEKLKMNLKRCSNLFENFQGIADKCSDAHYSGKMEQLRDAYAEVKRTMYIFGFKPDLKM